MPSICFRLLVSNALFARTLNFNGSISGGSALRSAAFGPVASKRAMAANRCRSLIRTAFLRYLPQLGNSSGVNPFGDINIASRIKTGVMGMEEFPGYPAFALFVAAQFHPVFEHLLAPRGIFAEVGNHLIFPIQKCY